MQDPALRFAYCACASEWQRLRHCPEIHAVPLGGLGLGFIERRPYYIEKVAAQACVCEEQQFYTVRGPARSWGGLAALGAGTHRARVSMVSRFKHLVDLVAIDEYPTPPDGAYGTLGGNRVYLPAPLTRSTSPPLLPATCTEDVP